MPLLKRRAKKGMSGKDNSALGLERDVFDQTTVNMSLGRAVKRSIKHMFIFIFFLIFGSIGSFFLYVRFMTRYNARNARDPCFVAESSLQTLNLLKKSGRQLSEPKTIRSKSGEVVQGLNNDKFEPGLPKIIHQQWKDQNIPKKFVKWQKKWFQFFPKGEYTYMIWDDESGRKLINDHYPWFLDTFDGYDHNINRVDATRYFILYHYGGIYADLDYEPILNFYDYLPSNMVGIIESPYFWNEKTQNALMSSPKSDPFWVDVFEKLVQNANKSNILEVSGPILMDQAAASSSSPSYILPCENFQRVPIGEYTQTIRNIVIHREMTFRLLPINGKQCGLYFNTNCHFGKHHNTASYVRTKNGGGIL